MSTPTRTRLLVLVAACALLLIGSVGGATAARMIGSADIKNNSIRSVDIKNGQLRNVDLAPAVRQRLDGRPLSWTVPAGEAEVREYPDFDVDLSCDERFPQLVVSGAGGQLIHVSGHQLAENDILKSGAHPTVSESFDLSSLNEFDLLIGREGRQLWHLRLGVTHPPVGPCEAFGFIKPAV